MYPELAVRELVANALLHQDFLLSGSGPTVEIFDNRIEITNPGKPLIDPLRSVDSPPLSRNEKLGRVMRRAGICEERGSGWDKIGLEIEFHQLPALLVEVTQEHTRVTLYSHRNLRDMDRGDRVRAVYLHAGLRFVSAQKMTNTSVRDRFGISSQSHIARTQLAPYRYHDERTSSAVTRGSPRPAMKARDRGRGAGWEQVSPRSSPRFLPNRPREANQARFPVEETGPDLR